MSRSPNISYESLVLKARPFFWLRGYHSVTPEELAQHLGVSLSFLYKKFDKSMLFISVLESYIETYTNPILLEVKNSEKGLETFRELFYNIADAFIDKTFPRSCMLVNSIIEMHDTHDKHKVIDLYSRYLENMKDSFTAVLEKAYKLGEIQNGSKIEQYADFLTSIVFELTVLYKCRSKEELYQYIDQQLSFIR